MNTNEKKGEEIPPRTLTNTHELKRRAGRPHAEGAEALGKGA
jgi:hypothetical protein